MKNKQMYKCNSREIHYASFAKAEWRAGDSLGVGSECVFAWDLQGGISLPRPARVMPATQIRGVGAASQLEGGR